MAIHYNPTTVSDGLVLALDAANTRSYGGSGTTWTDVSYNGNNGTLTNGPLYKTVGFTEPFGGAGGVYFDGNGDTLTLDGSAGNAGTGDFTMEFWFKGSKMEFNYTRTLHITSSGATLYFQLIYGGTIIQFSNSDWQNGNWHHHAIVRTGSTVKWYIDGVLKGTGTDSRSTNSATNFLIGQGFFGYMNGYVSNFRFVTSALYTSNFTPSKSLFTAVSNTSLLTCQKGSIIDASSNNFAITVNGDARPVYGFPSFKFDGSNDYAILNNNGFFNFGNGDFCIEANVFLTDYSSNYSGFYGATIFGKDSNPTREYAFIISGGASNYTSIVFFFNPGSGNLTESISGNYNFNLNTWYHTCISRIGNTMTLFVNGSVLTTTTTTSTISTTSVQPRVGSGGYGGYEYFFPGYISNTRVYKGKGLTAEEVQQNYNALKGRFEL